MSALFSLYFSVITSTFAFLLCGFFPLLVSLLARERERSNILRKFRRSKMKAFAVRTVSSKHLMRVPCVLCTVLIHTYVVSSTYLVEHVAHRFDAISREPIQCSAIPMLLFFMMAY